MNVGIVISLAGLVLGMLGAILLVMAVLRRDMATFGAAKDVIDPPRWWEKIPRAVASCCGSRDVVKSTTPDLPGAYALNFWGAALLLAGFVFQAVGLILPCR
jgi:hypothetical protein